MKSKWRLFLFMGLILLMTSSIVGCNESYTEKDGQGRNEYDTLKSDYDTLKAEYNTLEAEYDTLEDEYTTLTADYNALKVLYDDVSNELAEIKQSSEPEPEPTPEEPEDQQVIEDLAYIQASGWPYSDDADPESEGVDVRLSYYNSKSELIYFTDVSVKVTVELYWYSNIGIKFLQQVITDSSGGFESILRIPFDAIEKRPSGCTRNPILVVVVNTPIQGDFEYHGTEKATGIFSWP